jgi:hypothetical protein
VGQSRSALYQHKGALWSFGQDSDDPEPMDEKCQLEQASPVLEHQI